MQLISTLAKEVCENFALEYSLARTEPEPSAKALTCNCELLKEEIANLKILIANQQFEINQLKNVLAENTPNVSIPFVVQC